MQNGAIDRSLDSSAAISACMLAALVNEVQAVPTLMMQESLFELSVLLIAPANEQSIGEENFNPP